MGISTVGQGIPVSAIRHAVATAAVFLALFYFFYGPPLTDRLDQAAHAKCNQLTGERFRDYRLEWRTTTITSISTPHWVCHDLTRPGRSLDLGWWVGL